MRIVQIELEELEWKRLAMAAHKEHRSLRNLAKILVMKGLKGETHQTETRGGQEDSEGPAEDDHQDDG